MIQIHTTKNKRTIRASLKESTRTALTAHQDVKIPDGPITIDKDLLQRIYDQLAFIAWDKADSGCEDLQKELDSIYSFLKPTIMDNSKPAFPCLDFEGDPLHDGLSKREYFAGLSMQAIISCTPPQSMVPKPEFVAMAAVKFADALLDELKKEEQ